MSRFAVRGPAMRGDGRVSAGGWAVWALTGAIRPAEQEVPLAPPNPILNLTTIYKADNSARKLNLGACSRPCARRLRRHKRSRPGVGAYRTDEGTPYYFSAVRKVRAPTRPVPSHQHPSIPRTRVTPRSPRPAARCQAEERILADPENDKEYLPIRGLASFNVRGKHAPTGSSDARPLRRRARPLLTRSACPEPGALPPPRRGQRRHPGGPRPLLPGPLWHRLPPRPLRVHGVRTRRPVRPAFTRCDSPRGALAAALRARPPSTCPTRRGPTT